MSDKCSICKTGIRGNHYLYFVGKDTLIMHYRCSRKLFFAMNQQRTDEKESEKIVKKLMVR